MNAFISRVAECPEPITPAKLRRFMFLFVRQIFSNPATYNASYEDLACLKDGEGLDIRLSHTADPADRKGLKPSVFVTLGPLNFKKSVVNNYEGISEDNASETSTLPVTTTLTISHIMPSADAAYQLSDISTEAFASMRNWFMRTLDLRGLEVVQLTTPRELAKSPNKFYAVELQVTLDYMYSTTTVHEGHRLKTAILDAYNSSIDTI